MDDAHAAQLPQLTLDEKAALTSGHDLWTTVAIARVGIPALHLTDGPNGARGRGILGAGGERAICVPCASALGASWDPAVAFAAGAVVGDDARGKSCHVLLAPTVNIVRSPLAGRNFECYAEDPLLTGVLASEYVRGAQAAGVATTVKHFAGNEAETNRFTVDSIIDERALREIYLRPFEIVVQRSGVMGVMTAYNRLNGRFCGEHAWLITDVLRGEWGFEGFVLSDWYAAGSTIGSALAGLDLEMPGRARFFGPALAGAVRAGDVDEATLDAKVERLLRLIDTVTTVADTAATTRQPPDAADTMVLLRNNGVLPLERSASVAVIGPNADRAQIMGGGSAALNPRRWTTPLAALREVFAEVRYARGSDVGDVTPWLAIDLDVPAYERTLIDTRLVFMMDARDFIATGMFVPTETGPHEFTMVQSGRARLSIDGDVMLDGMADPPPPGTSIYGFGSEPMVATVELTAGVAVAIEIEYVTAGAEILTGVEIGCRRPPPSVERAVEIARAADAVVLVVGTTDVQESEDHDRTSLALPGGQDELIAAVAAANPRTVVVVNSGSAVAMPWADDVAAIVHVWFGGEDMGPAMARVLSGDAEPGGRLPITIPRRIEDTPAFGNFPGDGGETRYGEGVFVGYRWYEARGIPTQFPFGHGLSYTTFTWDAPTYADGTVTLTVTNTGTRRGAEVVQCYVDGVPKNLAGFAKVWLAPGESETVRVVLDERAFMRWQPSAPGLTEVYAQVRACNPEERDRLGEPPTAGWVVDPGVRTIEIGRSVSDPVFRLEVDPPTGLQPAG